MAFTKKLSEGISETKVFIWLLIACFLQFLARLPLLSREAHLDIDGPSLVSMIGGVLIGSIFLAPLVFYALSMLLCFVFRLWFRDLNWIYFRGAFFWSLLAISPLVLVRGILVGALGANFYINLLSILVFLYFIILIVSNVKTIDRVMNAN
ncbi:MAG: hypothetical protein H8E12_16715 [Rhodobacteraceae bacterium]|jgi:hypothetical protein|nr:hypothetical protein [Paracoccaceae bacterium]